jgi:hypothetical protein
LISSILSTSITVERVMEIKSHRVPRPLFARDFAGLKGCFGNMGRIFFAYYFAYDLLK